jgi:hypothetical protein
VGSASHGSLGAHRRLTVAYLMLYGNGWTQRCRLPEGKADRVRAEIAQMGADSTGHLDVVDPGSETEVTLVVAWRLVAAAVVIGATESSGADDTAGQYP